MAIEDIYSSVLAFDEAAVKAATQAELDKGSDVNSILTDGLIHAMDEVGERFSAGDLFVPEMLRAAKAMKGGLEVLRPQLASGATRSRGKVVIGTVKGDLHDIGKNLVAMMLEGSGFEVVDLGINVDSQAFVRAAGEHRPDVIGLSALLTTTMPAMADTIKAIRKAGFSIPALVGGAPVTRKFAEGIGADGYGDDAVGAVRLVKKLVANK